MSDPNDGVAHRIDNSCYEVSATETNIHQSCYDLPKDEFQNADSSTPSDSISKEVQTKNSGTSISSRNMFMLDEVPNAAVVYKIDYSCYKVTTPRTNSRSRFDTSCYGFSKDESQGTDSTVASASTSKRAQTEDSDIVTNSSIINSARRAKSFITTTESQACTPQLKRSYSDVDNSAIDADTPKREINYRHHYLQRQSFRSSLPSKLPKTPKTDEQRKLASCPTKRPPPLTPPAHRACSTDQTPYSRDDSARQPKRSRTILPSYNVYDLQQFKSKTGFIDSHCHLDFLFTRCGFQGTYKEFQQRNKETFPESYRGCVAVFCNPFTFGMRDLLWGPFLENENVWGTFGCHPHNAKDYSDQFELYLKKALKHPKVRALGEIGLDYSNRNGCKPQVQHEVFKRQLKIALKRDLPLVIHLRDSYDDGLKILTKYVPKDYPIHLHCFCDTWQRAKVWLKTFPNLCIGITNVVTFHSAENVHEVARNIPLDRLLLETDAPYFYPSRLPFKEKKLSHPGMAIHVAAQIAAIKEVSLDKVLKHTYRNTQTVYRL